MMPTPTIRKVAVAEAGTFLAVAGIDGDDLSNLLLKHRNNSDPGRCLKERFGTRVTRIPFPGLPPEVSAFRGGTVTSSGVPITEVAIKEVPVPARRRILYRVGWKGRFCGDFQQQDALLQRHVLTPPVLACSLHPRGATEFLLTEFIAGGQTLRELLWFGNAVLADPGERRHVLEAVGRWTRNIHDSGVWQRDLKPHNIVLRHWQQEQPEVYLLDTTDVRLLDSGVDLHRRIRNLGQVLDMPERLDEEVVHLLLAAYTDGAAHLQGLDTPVKNAMELRRRHRLRVDGFRSMDRKFESDGNGRNPSRQA